MCNPNPYQSAAHAESLGMARALSDHLSPRTRAYHEIWLDGEKVTGEPDEEPIYGTTYLPQQLLIGIAVPPSHDVDIFAHHLGFVAIVEKDKVIGYNVTVGGGMGMTHGVAETHPRLAAVMAFCKSEQVVEVADKV